MGDIKLTMFQCGTLKFHGPTGEDVHIPIPWFHIHHPKGNIVIDGGNALEVASDPRGHWGPVAESFFPVMSQDDFCVSAMKNVGYDPDDVKYVIQSHLHHDHTGAIGHFHNATHVVRRREYEYAFTPDWFTAQAYCRKDFDKLGLEWMFLDDTSVIDFFGDDTVLLVSTPGHSVGHQSIMLKLKNSGWMFLAIDAVMFIDHWDRKGVPGLTTSMIEAVRSIETVRGMCQRLNAKLVPGHDATALSAFDFAPASYT